MPINCLSHTYLQALLQLQSGRRITVLRNFAWLLATNLTSAHIAIKCHRRHMWIEEMFADFKGHGFDTSLEN